jgi:hypothetical protein
VSGRGTKVESALVVIPGYRITDLGTGAVSRYNVEASWLLSPVTDLAIGTGGSPG